MRKYIKSVVSKVNPPLGRVGGEVMISSKTEDGSNCSVINRNYKVGDIVEEWYLNGIIQESKVNGIVNFKL